MLETYINSMSKKNKKKKVQFLKLLNYFHVIKSEHSVC